MRRLEFLLNEVRESTDTKDNTITDKEIIGYYNDATRLIQNLIFKFNPKADLFKEVLVYDANSEGTYDLPDDIFAENALSLVEGQFGADSVNDGYREIDRIDELNRSNLFGYFTRNNKLIIAGSDAGQLQLGKVRLTYFKQVRKLDKRWGKIDTVNSGVSLVLAAGYDDTASQVDDYICVVDKLGATVLEGIFIDNFNLATWETTNALTGVVAGNYVVMGKHTSNVSELPNATETYLQDYVRQRLITRNNYEDGGKQVTFTKEQQADLISLFSNNTKENISPPTTDFDYLEF